jgi:serine/threonine-protein kinase
MAWLLGAATATAGCLLAVSLLGNGITSAGSGQLLSQDAANNELVSEAAKSTPGDAPGERSYPATSAGPHPTLATLTPSSTRSSASASASASRPSVTTPDSPTANSPTTDSPTAVATGSASAATTSAAPSGSTPAGTVLASPEGTVVATCQAGGAYLISWSPQQGYEVGDVFRGPAATASVQFESRTSEVTMKVSCTAGVPSATTSGDT